MAEHTPEQRLLRHLAVIVCGKLLLLGVLWWLFFQPRPAATDAEALSRHFLLATDTTATTTPVASPAASATHPPSVSSPLVSSTLKESP